MVNGLPDHALVSLEAIIAVLAAFNSRLPWFVWTASAGFDTAYFG